MNLRVDRARLEDVNELLALYGLIYGKSYPLALGSDAAAMANFIKDAHHLWLVVRDDDAKRVVGSLVCEVDPIHEIGRLLALVVHPEYRRHRLASRLAEEMVARLLGPESNLRSLYTTTRTVSVGPQTVFLNLGFLPLGIFPNAHRVKNYETLTLMARFRDGVLASRADLPPVPAKLLPIIGIFRGLSGVPSPEPEIAPPIASKLAEAPHDFELIDAPDFVKRRFCAANADPYDRFYPFHEPNLLLAAKGGGPEIYAYIGKADGYCTIVHNTAAFWEIAPSIESMVETLTGFGASYIEILISVDRTASISVLLENSFLPSAFYPAMQGNKDFVLLTRTAEPLNFRGMAVDRRFKPYFDQFVHLWRESNVDVFEVVDEIG